MQTSTVASEHHETTCIQKEYDPWCVFCYLAVSAIRVAYRHKDLREELLGLLLCVLLLCYTSGCIWGAPQITRDPRFNPWLSFFVVLHKPTYLKSQYMLMLKEYVEREKIQGERRDAGKTI